MTFAWLRIEPFNAHLCRILISLFMQKRLVLMPEVVSSSEMDLRKLFLHGYGGTICVLNVSTIPSLNVSN